MLRYLTGTDGVLERRRTGLEQRSGAILRPRVLSSVLGRRRVPSGRTALRLREDNRQLVPGYCPPSSADGGYPPAGLPSVCGRTIDSQGRVLSSVLGRRRVSSGWTALRLREDNIQSGAGAVPRPRPTAGTLRPGCPPSAGGQ